MAEKTRRLEVELEKSLICAEIISEDCDKIAGIVDYLKRPIDEVEEQSGPWLNSKTGVLVSSTRVNLSALLASGFLPAQTTAKSDEREHWPVETDGAGISKEFDPSFGLYGRMFRTIKEFRR